MAEVRIISHFAYVKINTNLEEYVLLDDESFYLRMPIEDNFNIVLYEPKHHLIIYAFQLKFVNCMKYHAGCMWVRLEKNGDLLLEEKCKNFYMELTRKHSQSHIKYT